MWNTIIESLQACEQSMFVFDEVDTMTPKLLNVLVPFLDRETIEVFYNNGKIRIIMNKAIFIFLSNTGHFSISDIMLKQRQQGKTRDNAKMSDFEQIIPNIAYKEQGGFEESETISSASIDHYVPFLPLEREHVKLCIKRAYEIRNSTVTIDDIDDIMLHITFGPEPENIYAKSGCKRIEQKVISKVFSKSRREARSEL